MKFRNKPSEDMELNITPLIDVVFLLLIFFMVSTTFQRETELKIQLPTASETQPQQIQKTIEVVINQSGHYFINGRELVNNKFVTLRTALAREASGAKDTPLLIRADALTPHQAVVTAMDAARQLGLMKLSIATSQQNN